MQYNMGTADRLIRTIVGLAIAAAGAYYASWWGLIAIVPLGTAYMGHCALYRLLEWSTVNKHK